MSEPAADLRGVEVRSGAATLLTCVDLRVERGERVALVGPSGAGKTTLLGLLNGSVSPSAGTVRVLGCALHAARPRARRDTLRRVATVHQDLAIADRLRVVHNVNAGRLGTWPLWRAVAALAWPRPDEAVRSALGRVELDDRMWDRTDRLSGGERQRVAVARALVQQPELLLADEPTANLDERLRDRVVGALVAGGSGRTVIAALHDTTVALDRFDRVVVLAAGRIRLDRPASDVSAAQLASLGEAPAR